MTRILAIVALLSTPLTASQAAETPQPLGKPNVVLFLVNDLGYGDVACHGNPHVKTPHVDAFAREATELTQFHVSPVCSPTRASLMTGRYNFRTGVADVYGKATNMDLAEVTLAERLREAGYVSGIFGKWHLGDDAQHGPNEQGFDEALVHRGPALGQYVNPPLLHNGQPEKTTGYCLDIFTDAAIRFIQQNRSRPFFVYLPANLIHTPLQVAPELAGEFDALGLGDSTRKIYGMIRNVDNNFGRVRAALQELGLEDNTLLIFTSDNGPCSGSQPVDRHMAGLHGLKGTVYENGIRVPCFLRWKLVQPCGMDLPNQQHIRNRYAQLCRLQGRGERSIEGPPRYELYDIAADPGETKDLAAEHPAIVEAMKKQYDVWFTDACVRWQAREEAQTTRSEL